MAKRSVRKAAIKKARKRRKPITVGEARKMRDDQPPASTLEMGPAQMDTSRISPMRANEREYLRDLTRESGTFSDPSRITDEYIRKRYDDPGNLGQVRSQKIKEMQDRLKSPLFKKRLADQGIHYDQEVLDRVSRGIETTPVRLAYMNAFGPTADYTPVSGHRAIRLNTQQRNLLPEQYMAGTLRHELEHDKDERFYAVAGKSLANEQIGILEQLGAIPEEVGPDGHKHIHSQTDDERLYTPGHVRIGIMAIRDELGKEFVTADDLLQVLRDPGPSGKFAQASWKGRDSREYLERMIATGKSLDEIAKLMNQVAVRQQAITEAQG